MQIHVKGQTQLILQADENTEAFYIEAIIQALQRKKAHGWHAIKIANDYTKLIIRLSDD